MQDREYGIGWGPRDLEYRRTVVTVETITDDSVGFCIMGLRSHVSGYHVTLNKSDARTRATCLNEWCTHHPEDRKP